MAAKMGNQRISVSWSERPGISYDRVIKEIEKYGTVIKQKFNHGQLNWPGTVLTPQEHEHRRKNKIEGRWIVNVLCHWDGNQERYPSLLIARQLSWINAIPGGDLSVFGDFWNQDEDDFGTGGSRGPGGKGGKGPKKSGPRRPVGSRTSHV